MKRMLTLLLVLLLTVGVQGALAEKPGEVSYERIVEAAMSLRESAHGDFMDIKGIPEDIQGRARDWTEGIDETPELLVFLDVAQSPLVLQYRAIFKAEHPMVAYEAESNAVADLINSLMFLAAYETPHPERTYNQLVDVLNGLNRSSLYADPDALDGYALYFVLWEDAEPLFILPSVENGAVALTSYIIPSMELAECSTYAQLVFWFMRMGCPITGAEILPE